ncbi:DNA-binding response regulator [Arenibacter sp. N53]|uniref:LytR/AlgR family response regulator transcription factor n=1 Tax=Arenibacter TaxID=178469 RepID=UPI000CD3C019|nr:MULTISPECIES: response regulator transcription factor [Arenibacter]MCM4150455.1 DNA-binding response regulator [Arenibacter sp. N53]
MINCIAIDDEPLALELLKDNISKVPFLNLVATCNNAFMAMETLAQHPVDLVFIDIQMPGLTGLQFIASLEKKPLVIFVTAYKQYAVESYDLDVVDYLVKPVGLERFIKACHRAKELFDLKSTKHTAPIKTVKDHFYVNVDYSQVKIVFDEIIWMKGYGDYIKFHLKSAEHPLVVRTSFKELDRELPPNKFIRIHKSYSVAIDAITAIRKNSIFLADRELSVGETFREDVEKLLRRES